MIAVSFKNLQIKVAEVDYQKLFNRLDEALVEHQETLDIFVIGGFVLEYHGLKATQDIDAFYESNAVIDRIIQEIGERYHVGTIDEPWLNHDVSQVASMSNRTGQVIYQGQGLKVTLASLETVLIDKMQVARQKDCLDIAKIFKVLGWRDLNKILSMLYYADSDPAVILESFALAYGEDALADYILEHPEIRRYLQ